jgi:hypothetical protein
VIRRKKLCSELDALSMQNKSDSTTQICDLIQKFVDERHPGPAFESEVQAKNAEMTGSRTRPERDMPRASGVMPALTDG